MLGQSTYSVHTLCFACVTDPYGEIESICQSNMNSWIEYQWLQVRECSSINTHLQRQKSIRATSNYVRPTFSLLTHTLQCINKYPVKIYSQSFAPPENLANLRITQQETIVFVFFAAYLLGTEQKKMVSKNNFNCQQKSEYVL